MAPLRSLAITSISALIACNHATPSDGELSRAQCVELVRKAARLRASDSAEQAEADRRERAAVEACLQSGTQRMFECVERARDLAELEDCERWKGK